MSGDEEIGKVLRPWLGKAKKIADPPQPSETRDSLGRGKADADGLTQLNFKIPTRTKRRVKLLAARDSITLLAMLDRMLELYEREDGKLDTKQ